MMATATVAGGQLLSNFVGSKNLTLLQELVAAGFGPQSTLFNGFGTVPGGTGNSSLIVDVLPGTSVIVPSGYSSVFDASGGDTINGGDNNLNVFLGAGTEFNTGGGSDLIHAGADTITAGSGSTTVIGADDNTVYGGSGSIIDDNSGGRSLLFVGGSGAVSVAGGSGNSIMFGSTSAASSYLRAGSGNSTLLGGSGTGASTLIGGGNVVEFARGSGPTTFIAGTGHSIIDGATGSGPELIFTSAVGKDATALIALNNAADTVVGGSGNSTVIGGGGPDLYGFIAGHAGGSETIFGLKADDAILFGGYGKTPIASESVSNGSDAIKLSDGTTITLVGIDHKLFS
jgi:serralysin